MREGLARCRDDGAEAVVVLGHPEYYPRFGFRRASDLSLRSEYNVAAEALMAQELLDGALRGHAGTVRCDALFGAL